MDERERHTESRAGERGYEAEGRTGGDGVPEREPWSVRSRRYRYSRRAFRIWSGIVAALLFLVAALIIVLQTEWGRDQVKHVTLQRLNALFDGAELTAEDLAGNIIGNFVLVDVNLVTAEGERLAHIDTLSANYNLLGLLQNRLILRDIDLISPAVWMEQEADGSWDLLNVIAKDDSVAVDTVDSYWNRLVIQLDELSIVEGSLEAGFYAPGRDSTLRLRALSADLGDAEIGDNPTFQVDTLTTDFSPPGMDYWGEIVARGALEDEAVQVEAIRIRSPNTFLESRGTLRLPTEETTYMGDVNFALMANPLTFEDIRPFVPGLKAQGKVDILLRGEGTVRRLVVDGDASFSLGGTLSLDGVFTSGGGGLAEYAFDAEVRRLNPTTLLGTSVEPGVLNADLDLALQGTSTEQLTGSLNAVLFNSAYGQYALERAVLESTWEDGLANFDVQTAIRGASLDAEGAIRPFADVVPYDITARVANLDLGRFLMSDITTDLTGSIAIEGSGLQLESAQADMDVRLAPSTVNGYLIEDAALDMRLEDGDLDFGARVLVPEGRLIAEGGLAFGDELVYEVRRGQFENFNWAAFFGPDTVQSAFTGTFTVDGRGTDPETLDADFNVNLASGRFRTIAIADADVRGTLRSGLLRAAAEVDLEQAGFFDLAFTSRPFRDPASATIERGVFRDVNLGLLLNDPDLDTDVSGTIAGAVRGFDPQSMAFDGRIELSPSRINQQQITDATLVADLNGSDLAFDLSLATPEGRTRLEGTAQPFLEVPTYTVRDGSFEQLNLGALLGRPDLTTALSGNVSFRGRGLNPETLTLQGTLDLRPSRINRQIINDAVVSVNVQQGILDFTANIDLPEGDTRLVGDANLLAAQPTYRIREGRFERFNVGALLGIPDLDTEVTGDIQLEGRGFNLATGAFEGRIRLDGSRINEQIIDEAILDASLQQGTLDFALQLDLTDGQAHLEGVAQVNQDPITYTVTEGSFQNINLAAFTNNPNLESNLIGTLTANGSGFDPETMILDGTLTLVDSRINEQNIDAATIDVGLDRGNLTYAAVIDTPQGETSLAGTAQPFLDLPTYSITEGEFDELNVSALLGLENQNIILTGDVELEGRGFDPDSMYLDLSANLTHAILNEEEVMSAELEALLRDGLLRFDTDMVFEEGRAQVRASVQPFLERPTYDIVGTLVNVDLGGILGTDTLQAEFNADFEVAGAGLDPETMTIQGSLQAESSQYQSIAVDSLNTSFRLANGLLQLDALYLRSNIADATAEGQIALFDTTAVSDFTLDAYIKDIEPLRPIIGARALAIGEGTIEGRVYGQAGTLQFDLTTDISRFVYNDIRVSGLDGRIAGELGPDRRLRLGELNAQFDFLAIPGLAVQGSNFQINYEGDDIVFSGDVVIDDRREGVVEGRIDLRPESRSLSLENFTLQFEDDTWELLQPASLSLAGEYRISNFLLYSGDQQIAIDGVIDPNGEQNLILTIESFNLATVTDLIGYEGLNGTLSGSLVMSGPASAPIVEGSLALDSLASEDQVAGDMRMDLHYEDMRLNIEALLRNVEQGRLAVNGYIPMNLRLAPSDSVTVAQAQVQGVQVQTAQAGLDEGVNLTIAADSFSIGWLEPFFGETAENILGTLQADIVVTGTLRSPQLDGDFALTQGQLRLLELGATWRDISATGTLANNIIQLQEAIIHSGEGQLTGRGTIALEELTLGAIDIDLLLDDFRTVDNDDYQEVILSGTPHLEGTTDAPVLTGSIEVQQGDIYLENVIAPNFELVPLTERDLNMLEEVFGYRITEEDTSTFALFDALTLDLNLELDRNTWLRQRTSPELAIQFSGRIDVLKQPYTDVQVFGTIEVVPERSYIDQFGRRFDITSGVLTMTGPIENTRMDIDAQYVVRSREAQEPEVTITLGLEGEFNNMELVLGSDAGLPNTDIVSYIATGNPADTPIDLGTEGTQLAIGQLTSLVESFANEEFGLDVVEIEYDPQYGAQLVVGEYVGNNLFVSVQQAFNQGGNNQDAAEGGAPGTQIEVEYEIMDWLLLRFIGGQSTLRINLLYEQAY